MKKSMIVVLIMLFMISVGYAGGFEVKKQVGDYTVIVTIDNNPPVVGKNKATIEIKDKANKVVKDAKVRVDYSMPAMPNMPPMDYKEKAELKGDKYEATMDLSMAGSWGVVVKFKQGEGKVQEAKFSLDAR
ncbi:MAG: FixH family protein [Candidatus Magnetoovum sp. WYHC-5]|nr:FixH family protein [Candidatus Magnetoovum sp. WYHC-5]